MTPDPNGGRLHWGGQRLPFAPPEHAPAAVWEFVDGCTIPLTFNATLIASPGGTTQQELCLITVANDQMLDRAFALLDSIGDHATFRATTRLAAPLWTVREPTSEHEPYAVLTIRFRAPWTEATRLAIRVTPDLHDALLTAGTAAPIVLTRPDSFSKLQGGAPLNEVLRESIPIGQAPAPEVLELLALNEV